MINTPRLSAANFRLVAVLLALVEHIANSHGPSIDSRSSVSESWTFWADTANIDSHAHGTLVRPILGTFLRLAALASDASPHTFCVRQVLVILFP